MKTLSLAAIVLLLSACQVTTFEKPPIAEAACDRQLVGLWSSIGDDADEDGEMQLDISSTCSLDVSDRHQGEMRHGEATQLHVGKLGSQAYLWVDSSWAEQRFESDLPPHPGDIYLLRYEVKNDELSLNSTNDKVIAHRIIDDEIPGDTSKIGHDLHNRVTGGPHPALLETPGLFKDEAIRFRRGSGTATP